MSDTKILRDHDWNATITSDFICSLGIHNPKLFISLKNAAYEISQSKAGYARKEKEAFFTLFEYMATIAANKAAKRTNKTEEKALQLVFSEHARRASE